jgi:CheY-like chemotaxis protein
MESVLRRAAQPACGDLSRARVLFVNADADLRAVVSRVLEREGYRVDAVAHSGHALLRCRTEQFDVLIAELSGPDRSGPALAEQVRRHCPDIKTTYLSNPGTPEGVENVIVRPFTRDDLLERIGPASRTLAA